MFLEGDIIIVYRLTFAHVSWESPSPWGAATFGHKLDSKGRHFVLATLLPILSLPGSKAKATLDKHRLTFSQIFTAAFSLLTKYHDIDKAGIILPLIALFHAVIHRQPQGCDWRP